MNFASVTPPQSPAEAFQAASASYTKAIDLITFEPNERVDVRVAVTEALGQATEAIAYLQPFSNANADMFTERSASASITAATTGVTALNNALAALDYSGPAGPQIPVSTFLTVAQNSLKVAENALWQE